MKYFIPAAVQQKITKQGKLQTKNIQSHKVRVLGPSARLSFLHTVSSPLKSINRRFSQERLYYTTLSAQEKDVNEKNILLHIKIIIPLFLCASGILSCALAFRGRLYYTEQECKRENIPVHAAGRKLFPGSFVIIASRNIKYAKDEEACGFVSVAIRKTTIPPPSARSAELSGQRAGLRRRRSRAREGRQPRPG